MYGHINQYASDAANQNINGFIYMAPVIRTHCNYTFRFDVGCYATDVLLVTMKSIRPHYCKQNQILGVEKLEISHSSALFLP